MNQTLTNWTRTETNSTLPETYITDFIFLAFISAYYFLLSCGAVLNITVVFVMLRSGKIRQNISSFLIFHLSLTHLFYLTTSVLPFFLNSSSHASCIAKELTGQACAAAIFNSLVAIAWDRHRNVLRPFKSLAPRHLKTYLMLVAAIWTYAFVTSAPFIYSVRTETVKTCSKENNGTLKCKEQYSLCHLPPDWKTQLSRTIYVFLAFVIPLLYMLLAYTNIAVSLWKRSKTGIIHGAVAKCKVKSTRLMVVAVLGFVFCWGPTFWVDLLTVYGAIKNSFLLGMWCRITQTSSSCINPAIYAFFSPEFRKLFVRFCCCGCSCRMCARRGLPERGNRVQPVTLTRQAAS